MDFDVGVVGKKGGHPGGGYGQKNLSVKQRGRFRGILGKLGPVSMHKRWEETARTSSEK